MQFCDMKISTNYYYKINDFVLNLNVENKRDEILQKKKGRVSNSNKLFIWRYRWSLPAYDSHVNLYRFVEVIWFYFFILSCSLKHFEAKN